MTNTTNNNSPADAGTRAAELDAAFAALGLSTHALRGMRNSMKAYAKAVKYEGPQRTTAQQQITAAEYLVLVEHLTRFLGEGM